MNISSLKLEQHCTLSVKSGVSERDMRTENENELKPGIVHMVKTDQNRKLGCSDKLRIFLQYFKLFKLVPGSIQKGSLSLTNVASFLSVTPYEIRNLNNRETPAMTSEVWGPVLAQSVP